MDCRRSRRRACAVLALPPLALPALWGQSWAGLTSRGTRGRGQSCLGRIRVTALADAYDLGSKHIGDGEVDATIAWQRVEQLRQRLDSYPDLPGWNRRPARDNAGLLWWFLRDRRLDVDEAAKKLVKCLRWRQEFRVDRLGPELFAREMRTRKGYVHQHVDVAGRPVLVAIARRHNIFERNLHQSSQMCAWMLETALSRLAMPEPPSLEGDANLDSNEPEQALGIFDLRDFSPLQADLEVAGFLIEALYNYYPGRTGRVLLVGAPEIFKSFWENVKPLLGRYSALADFVTSEQLCSRYFEPGREPPEFASTRAMLDQSGRVAQVQQRAAMLRKPLASGSAAPLLFAGATLCAGAARRRWSVRSAALSGLGTQQIGGGLLPVDSETAERYLELLQEYLRRTPGLKWQGRPAVENRGLLWWFLRDRRFDVAEAGEKLVQCLQWRREFRVEKLGPELFPKEARTRKAYLHQHVDVAGRPALMVVARRHNVLERQLKESQDMCAWYMERILERLAMTDPRGPRSGAERDSVEQALALVDLNGFSPLQADLEFVGFMIDVLHKYYPGRFARILLIDAPDIFQSFWQSVCPLLHRYKDLADFVTAREVCERYFEAGLAPVELQRR